MQIKNQTKSIRVIVTIAFTIQFRKNKLTLIEIDDYKYP
jgi:hypothetical protein